MVRVPILALVMAAGRSPALATSCAYDANAPTLKQMIRMGTTGDPYYDTLLLGRVIDIRDHRRPGGPAVAVLRVWAAPVGHGSRYVRVRFALPRPSDGVVVVPGERIYQKGDRYAVVGHRSADGAYVDDGLCGSTRPLTLTRLKILLRYAREFR